MSKMSKALIVIGVIFLLASCVACLVFGITTLPHQIDNIVAAGPGSMITTVLALLLSWYCLPPIILIVVAAIILIIAYKYLDN